MTPHCFWCLKPTLIISFHNCFHQDHRLCRNNERTNLQKKINSKNCIFLVQLKQNIACRGIRAIRKIISHKCLKGFAFNQQNFHVGIIRYKSYTEVSLAIISFFLISINCPIFSFMIISKLGDPNSATLKTQQQNAVIQMQSLLLRFRMMKGTSTAKVLKIQHRRQKDAKRTQTPKLWSDSS